MPLCWRASVYNDLFCQFVYSKDIIILLLPVSFCPLIHRLPSSSTLLLECFGVPSLLLTHRISPAGPRLMSLPFSSVQL